MKYAFKVGDVVTFRKSMSQYFDPDTRYVIVRLATQRAYEDETKIVPGYDVVREGTKKVVFRAIGRALKRA